MNNSPKSNSKRRFTLYHSDRTNSKYFPAQYFVLLNQKADKSDFADETYVPPVNLGQLQHSSNFWAQTDLPRHPQAPVPRGGSKTKLQSWGVASINQGSQRGMAPAGGRRSGERNYPLSTTVNKYVSGQRGGHWTPFGWNHKFFLSTHNARKLHPNPHLLSKQHQSTFRCPLKRKVEEEKEAWVIKIDWQIVFSWGMICNLAKKDKGKKDKDCWGNGSQNI